MKQFTQYLPSTAGKTLRVSVVKDAGRPMYALINEGVAEYRNGQVFSFETRIPEDYIKRIPAPFDWTCTKRNRERLLIQVQAALIADGKLDSNEPINFL